MYRDYQITKRVHDGIFCEYLKKKVSFNPLNILFFVNLPSLITISTTAIKKAIDRLFFRAKNYI